MNKLEIAMELLKEATNTYNSREKYKKQNGRYPLYGYDDIPPKARITDDLKMVRRMLLEVMEEVGKQ